MTARLLPAVAAFVAVVIALGLTVIVEALT